MSTIIPSDFTLNNIACILPKDTRMKLFEELCKTVAKRVPERVSLETGIRKTDVYRYLPKSKSRKGGLVPSPITTAKVMKALLKNGKTEFVANTIDSAVDDMRKSYHEYFSWKMDMKDRNVIDNPWWELRAMKPKRGRKRFKGIYAGFLNYRRDGEQQKDGTLPKQDFCDVVPDSGGSIVPYPQRDGRCLPEEPKHKERTFREKKSKDFEKQFSEDMHEEELTDKQKELLRPFQEPLMDDATLLEKAYTKQDCYPFEECHCQPTRVVCPGCGKEVRVECPKQTECYGRYS